MSAKSMTATVFRVKLNDELFAFGNDSKTYSVRPSRMAMFAMPQRRHSAATIRHWDAGSRPHTEQPRTSIDPDSITMDID